jgi:hypothetical protein
MTERTPLQLTAKRLYDALDKAQAICCEMIEMTNGKQKELFTVEHDIERCFDHFIELMHEGDCK